MITAQMQHDLISTHVQVDKVDSNLFKSRFLWLPLNSHGAFGGQVISQAVSSVCQYADPAYHLHSLHGYFLASASPTIPIVYQVDELRGGRSYITYSVKALQNDGVTFMMLCSFARLEPRQKLSHQWKMPSVPGPDECEYEDVHYARVAKKGGIHKELKSFYEKFGEERKLGAIVIKAARENVDMGDGTLGFYYWMRARGIANHDAPTQKAILAYMSDLYLVSIGARTLGLGPFADGNENKKSLIMMSTINHSVNFYSNDFNCGEWLLYSMFSPRSGSGRAMMQGRFHSQGGSLLAVTSQEAVVRGIPAKVDKPKL